MAAKRALVNFLRKLIQPIRVHRVPHEKQFLEPGFTDGPVLGGLEGMKRRHPLVLGHCKDRTLMDAFPAAGATINLDHLLEGEL
jgi:hypothetical protein